MSKFKNFILASWGLGAGFSVLFLLLIQTGCTGSGAVNPLNPNKQNQPDSAAPADSDVIYWTSFPVTFTVTDPLNGVILISKKLGWACGNNGLVLKYEGDTWTKVDTGLAKNENLLGAAFANENEGWMVGSHGTILHYNNGIWNLETSQTEVNLNSVAVTRAKTVWVVGSGGTILTYNGVTWGRITALATDTAGAAPTTVTEDLNSVGLSDQNNGWAVGARGTILRYDGQKWQAFAASPTTERLNSVSVISDVQAWIVGAFGTILRFNGTTWGKQGTASAGLDLFQIYMKDDNNGWTVGQDGTLLYYDGTHWISHQKPLGKPALNALSLMGNLGFAVGANGTILKYQPNGELAKFSFLFKNEPVKKPNQENPFWTITYTLMNQSPKTSPFVTYELPMPKGFEPYEKKATATPTPPTGGPLAALSPVPALTGTATAAPAFGSVPPSLMGNSVKTATAVSGSWKMKDNTLVWEIGTVAPSEMKTVTVLIHDKKNEKKEFPVILKAVLRSVDKITSEAAPVTLLRSDPAVPVKRFVPLITPNFPATPSVKKNPASGKGGNENAQPTVAPGN